MAGQRVVHGRAVIADAQFNAVNPGQLVHAGRQVWKKLGHPVAGLAVPGELVGRGDHPVRSRSDLAHRAGCATISRHALSVKFFQRGDVLERVHLADAPFHEQEDAAFGLAGKVGRFHHQRMVRGGRAGVTSQQVQQRNATQAQVRLA